MFNDSFNPSRRVLGISSDLAGGDTIFVVTSDAVYKVWGSYVGIQQISTEIPQRSALSQNYPNPFNPITNFEFRIADFGLVKLTVFDAIGREIEVLVNQQLQPGTYEVSWNASAYPSGVYYYRLSAGEFTQTKPMLLLK
jgi:hypothetical protein